MLHPQILSLEAVPLKGGRSLFSSGKSNDDDDDDDDNERDDDARVVSFCRFTDGDRVGSTARWGSTRPCCPQTAHD